MILLLLLLVNFQRSGVPPVLVNFFFLAFVDAGIPLVCYIIVVRERKRFQARLCTLYTEMGLEANTTTTTTPCLGHAGQFEGC